MAKFSIPILYMSWLLPTGYKILWGSQSKSDLRIFGVQKPNSDVKTSTGASAVILGQVFPNKLLALHIPNFSLEMLKIIKVLQKIVFAFARPAYHFTHKCERTSGILHP